MSHDKIYGHIPGIPVGTTFANRAELLRAGVHAQMQAGISGDSTTENGGAFSICLSGGYEDNKDRGDRITYVGSGGQNRDSEQVEDQSFEHPHNKALLISCNTKRPVRVIRGENEENFYSPQKGYRYDGLYVVDSAEMKPGKRNYNMCTFELRRIQEEGVGPVPSRRLLNTKKLSKMMKAVRTR